MNKKENYVLLIIILVISVCILALLYLNDEDDEISLNEEIKYKLVDDYSAFFTVNSCIYKYITYLSSNKTDDLINVLDKEYVLSNNIDSNNIYNYVNKLSGNYSFKAKKMYYQISDEKIEKYFVYGYLIEETIDGVVSNQDYYLIVNLDTENQLFSIAPYNGQIFKEES